MIWLTHESSAEAFNDAITLWMIWTASGFLDAKQFAELFYKVTIQLVTLINNISWMSCSQIHLSTRHFATVVEHWSGMAKRLTYLEKQSSTISTSVVMEGVDVCQLQLFGMAQKQWWFSSERWGVGLRLTSASCKWCRSVGFIKPQFSTLHGAVCCRVWSSWVVK